MKIKFPKALVLWVHWGLSIAWFSLLFLCLGETGN